MQTCDVHVTANNHGVFFLCFNYVNCRFCLPWDGAGESAQYFARNQPHLNVVQVLYSLGVEHCIECCIALPFIPCSNCFGSAMCIWMQEEAI